MLIRGEENISNCFCMKIKILTGEQEQFLLLVGKNAYISKSFYLTGGTALAAFYLNHRYSEDLDFFSESAVDILPINVFLKEARKQLGVLIIDYQSSYNRNLFFLKLKNGNTLKVEFTHFPFPRIQGGRLENGIQLDSLIDIAVNKLFTIYQRVHARDYIDLYAICKEKGFSISDLTEKVRTKFDWHIDSLQLGTQFLRAKEAVDYPRLIAKAESKEWVAFFESEAKKLKPQIIDK